MIYVNFYSLGIGHFGHLGTFRLNGGVYSVTWIPKLSSYYEIYFGRTIVKVELYWYLLPVQVSWQGLISSVLWKEARTSRLCDTVVCEWDVKLQWYILWWMINHPYEVYLPDLQTAGWEEERRKCTLTDGLICYSILWFPEEPCRFGWSLTCGCVNRTG